MRVLGAVLAFLAVALAGCMELDGFLANEEPLDAYQLPGNTIPEALIEPVQFDSDGHKLHGYWVGSNGIRPGVTVLYCHGNKHHLDEYWDRVMLLHELGVNVLIFDYRGFGRSEGTFSEKAMLADARAALTFALARPEVTVDSLGIYGFSLGNVASVHLAAEAVDPLFLVAESPFASARSLTQGATNLPIPAGWVTTGTFDVAGWMRRVQAPVLVIHGEADDFVRFRDNGRVVYDAAPEPKRLIAVPAATHSNIPEIMEKVSYLHVLREWMDQAAGR